MDPYQLLRYLQSFIVEAQTLCNQPRRMPAAAAAAAGVGPSAAAAAGVGPLESSFGKTVRQTVAT